MVSRRICLVVLAAVFAVAFARPGAPIYPSEEENIIQDYAYDNEQDLKSDTAYIGSWKSVPEENPDKFYEVEVSATNAGSVPAEPSTTTVTETKAAEVVDVARAADVAGSVGAVAAVRAVEVVKAALETTETPESTTTSATTYPPVSGRALDDDDERAQGDAPTPTTDQTLYGFSKFLHDLLQVPVQVMRSVSSYLSGAFISHQEPISHDAPSHSIANPTPAEHAALTSALLSQSF